MSCDSVANGKYVVIKIIPIILKLEARFISQIRQYMQVQVVVLQTKGDTKQSKVEITGEIEDEIPIRIAKILRKTKLPSKIGSWTYQKGALELWGYKEGRAGTENKHELPPPVDSTLIFSTCFEPSILEFIQCPSLGSKSPIILRLNRGSKKMVTFGHKYVSEM
jgi:hypothetical protein